MLSPGMTCHLKLTYEVNVDDFLSVVSSAV